MSQTWSLLLKVNYSEEIEQNNLQKNAIFSLSEKYLYLLCFSEVSESRTSNLANRFRSTDEEKWSQTCPTS